MDVWRKRTQAFVHGRRVDAGVDLFAPVTDGDAEDLRGSVLKSDMHAVRLAVRGLFWPQPMGQPDGDSSFLARLADDYVAYLRSSVARYIHAA